MTHDHPVPSPAAHGMSRYDTDPDALNWARTRVQHQIDRLAALEERATETGKTELAAGLSMARRSTEQLLLGGEGCVVGAFDERRPTMFGGAAPTPTAATTVDSDPAARLQAAATHLRTLIAAVPPAPWKPGGIGDYGWTVQMGDPASSTYESLDTQMDSEEGKALARFIAAMGPQVGEALAAWLDRAAHSHTATLTAAQHTWTSVTDPRAVAWVEKMTDTRALALADAILDGAGQ